MKSLSAIMGNALSFSLHCKKLEYMAGGRCGVQKYHNRREEEVREHG